MSRREEVLKKIAYIDESLNQLTEFNAPTEALNCAVNSGCVILLKEIAMDLATIVDEMNK